MLQTYTPGYKVEFSQAEPMAESCQSPSLPKQPFPASVMQNTTQPEKIEPMAQLGANSSIVHPFLVG